jgi:hypothetical protein
MTRARGAAKASLSIHKQAKDHGTAPPYEARIGCGTSGGGPPGLSINPRQEGAERCRQYPLTDGRVRGGEESRCECSQTAQHRFGVYGFIGRLLHTRHTLMPTGGGGEAGSRDRFDAGDHAKGGGGRQPLVWGLRNGRGGGTCLPAKVLQRKAERGFSRREAGGQKEGRSCDAPARVLGGRLPVEGGGGCWLESISGGAACALPRQGTREHTERRSGCS